MPTTAPTCSAALLRHWLWSTTGQRALGARPLESLGGKQLTVPGFASVDLGLRQHFTIGKTAVSYRAVWQNVFDAKSWKVVAANTALYPEERRRFQVTFPSRRFLTYFGGMRIAPSSRISWPLK